MGYDYKEAMKLENQICFPLYAAARNIVNRYAQFLKPLGLTYTQYIVFLVLWEQDEITVGEICSRLMLDNGTISPLLKKMQQAGYIEKKRSREDDRVVVIALTQEGRQLQRKAKDIPLKMMGCVSLPEEKGRELYALLHELIDRNQCAVKKEKENRNENSL
ncbi:MAG: MarR family transcriptional regulator [Lachnospiraceae bacterium]|nr:MarR family transcriptional regulator [Lachnospiraceae bacterium]